MDPSIVSASRTFMPDHTAEAPEISVVIPCRNEEDNAEAIAAAVIAQLEPGADFQPSVSQGPNRFQGR
jgi:hypothetical protein